MSCDIENFRKWIKANDLTPIMSVVEDDLELLTNLDLSKRNIKDLPESIGVLKNLTVLKLSNNKLRKLPKAIGELKKLRNLQCENNLIEELPSTIGDLPDLMILNLLRVNIK
jgi:Leucine-rich repeat (LRR) protein